MVSLFCLLCAKLLFHICEKKIGIESIWTKLLAKTMQEPAIEKIRFLRNSSSSVQHPHAKKVCVCNQICVCVNVQTHIWLEEAGSLSSGGIPLVA